MFLLTLHYNLFVKQHESAFPYSFSLMAFVFYSPSCSSSSFPSVRALTVNEMNNTPLRMVFEVFTNLECIKRDSLYINDLTSRGQVCERG